MTTESALSYPPRKAIYLLIGLALAALITGALHAYSLKYVNDDCFVSFRYAKNLINGLGLVYNAGERVEGYTNFLWTIIIASGMKMGFDPVQFSMVLGIVFYLLTLLLYACMSWKLRSTLGQNLFLIPLAAIALSLHRDFNAYATSGMETSLFTFLVSSAFAALLTGGSPRSYFGAGLLLLLAMMTRPDGVIFAAAGAVYLLLAAKSPVKSFLLLGAPIFFIFLPYWIWRYSYYGFFFPNTFYAKSIDLPYYSQGLTYTFMYFKTYYVFILTALLGIVLIWRHRKIFTGLNNPLPWVKDQLRAGAGRPRPVLLSLLFILGYLLFIIRIGGDFMFARFFVPITPMMYFLTEHLINKATGRVVHLVLVAVVVVATIFRFDLFGNGAVVGYVADEARYYSGETLKQSQSHGAVLHKYFEGRDVRVAFWAGGLMLMYYADPFYAMEASAGLTDTSIAHTAIRERGRPGHEKQATLEYLMKKRIHFFVGPVDPPTEPGQLVLNLVVFDSILAKIIVYDNAIMSGLAAFPGVRFNRFPEYLDSYIAEMHSYPREKVEQDYGYFKPFYFDVNNDRRRQEAFLSFLNPAGNPPRSDSTHSPPASER